MGDDDNNTIILRPTLADKQTGWETNTETLQNGQLTNSWRNLSAQSSAETLTDQ